MAHMALEDITSGVASDVEDCKAARSTRYMSSAAMVLAVLSAALIVTTQCFAARRRSEARSVDVVGLAATGPWSEPALDGSPLGWHRTYLPSVVRQGPSADSPVVQELPTGSLIYATAAEGRSLRLSRPATGWLAASTSDRVGAVYPEMALQGLGDDADTEAALRSDARASLNARLRAQVAEVTKLHRQLADNVRKMRAMAESTEPQRISAPKLAGALSAVAATVAADHGVSSVAKKVAGDRGLQRLIRGSRNFLH
mmetsp:Transcript_47197/g.132720  ORF Transcript_47197/g.132720 Transcript_47197/m.132720 type:complete len:256 (+) Transcript_47197:102-869(+)